MDITIATIPPLLITLNQLLKQQGMKSKWAPIINIIGGLLMYAGIVSPLPVTFQDWIKFVIVGVMVGTSAGGIYSVGKKQLVTPQKPS